jgi:hypothetical protein
MILSGEKWARCVGCHTLMGALKSKINHTLWQGRDDPKVLNIGCDPTIDRDVNGRY